MRNRIILPLIEDLLKGPQNQQHPRLSNAISSMGWLRKRLTENGMSETSSDLIGSLIGEDTLLNLSTYSLAWNKRFSWCVEQNVDPVRYNVNWILDFLAFLFESGYEYRTICTHRSAFLALHNNTEGRPVESTCVLLLQVCSIIDHLSENITLSVMFSWYWITWKKIFQTKAIYQINFWPLKLQYYWLLRLYPG